MSEPKRLWTIRNNGDGWFQIKRGSEVLATAFGQKRAEHVRAVLSLADSHDDDWLTQRLLRPETP